MKPIYNYHNINKRSTDINSSYSRVEIEAVDHNNVVWSKKSNLSGCKDVSHWGEPFATGTGNKDFSYDMTVHIKEDGEYRLYFRGRTNYKNSNNNPLYSDLYFPKEINTDTIRVFWESYARVPQRKDLGTFYIKKGTYVFKCIGSAESMTGNITFHKIRRYEGDTNNNGLLTFDTWNFSENDIQNTNSGSIELFSINQKEEFGGFIDKNSPSGFIFNYRDSINIYASENLNDLEKKPVFGGYITEITPTKDRDKIKLGFMDRWFDTTTRSIPHETIVGGDTPDYSKNTVYCNDKYEAMMFVLDNMEYPIDYTNLISYIESMPPTESDWNFDLDNPELANKISVDVKTLNSQLAILEKQKVKLDEQVKTKKDKVEATYKAAIKKIDNDFKYDLKLIDNEYAPKLSKVDKDYAKELKACKTAVCKTNVQIKKDKAKEPILAAKKKKKQPIEDKKAKKKEPHSETKKKSNKEIDQWKLKQIALLELAFAQKVSKTNSNFLWVMGVYKRPIAGSKSKYLELQNYPMKNVVQKALIWKKDYEPPGKQNIKITAQQPVFEFDYGMAQDYMVDKPFMGHLQVGYSLTPDGTVFNGYISFTGTKYDSSSGLNDIVLGAVTPVIELNSFKKFQFDLQGQLYRLRGDSKDTIYYLRSISFINYFVKGSDTDLTDYDKEKDGNARKILINNLKLRSGEINLPTTLKSSGEYPLKVLRELAKDTNLTLNIIPSTTRSLDTLVLENKRTKVETTVIREGDNLIGGIDDIKYSPNGVIINTSNKVYTNSNDHEIYTSRVDMDSIHHYGTLESYEVLPKEITGINQALYLAGTDLKPDEPPLIFPATIKGIPSLKVGRLITTDLTEDYLSDLKEITSIDRSFNRNDSPMLQTELGLDGEIGEYKVDINKIRAKIEELSKLRTSGAEIPDEIDI